MKECIEINSITDSRPFIYMIASGLEVCGFSVIILTKNERMLNIIDENGYNSIRNIQFVPADIDNVDMVFDQVKDQADFIIVDNLAISENTRYIALMPFVVEDLIEYDLNIKNETNSTIIFYGKSLVKKPKKKKQKEKDNGEVWELERQEDAIIESLSKSLKLQDVPSYDELVGFENAGKLLTLNSKEADFFLMFFEKYVTVNKNEWKKGLMKKHECSIKTNASILW